MMTVLSAQAIRQRGIFTPFCERSKVFGMSYGLSPCGYDIRIEQGFKLFPGEFSLGSTVEHFIIPADLVGIVHDKSTWARLGIAVQNTVIEPGWRGQLVVELTNHSDLVREIMPGSPIAQVVLHKLDEETEQPYAGRYQDRE
jgi:dCTP deaminase